MASNCRETIDKGGEMSFFEDIKESTKEEHERARKEAKTKERELYKMYLRAEIRYLKDRFKHFKQIIRCFFFGHFWERRPVYDEDRLHIKCKWCKKVHIVRNWMTYNEW